MKTQAIIPAAGIGTRLHSQEPKPLVLLKGKPLFVHALEALEQSVFVDSIIVVSRQQNLVAFEKIIQDYKFLKVKKVVAGGKKRRDSVYNGLQALDSDTELVLIHDGARPLVSTPMIDEAIKLCKKNDAVVVAVPVKPTIKRVDKENMLVEQTLNRDLLWEAQTPQVFKKNIIVKAHEQFEDSEATDDAYLVEQLGGKIKVLEGNYYNIKITTQEDLKIAEAFLS